MASFGWVAPALDVGLGALNGIGQFAALGAQDRVSEANARARNQVRAAQNLKKSGELSLAATVRSINNRRVLEQGGRAFEAATTNALRTADSFARANFEATIRDAEQYGAASARSAASGVGGVSIQAVGMQTTMRAERARQDRLDRQGEITYDQLQALTGIMPDAASRLDISPMVLGRDNTISTSARQQQGGLFSALLAGLLSKKDSLQTLLGSFGASDQTNAAPGVTVSPVYRGTAEGTDLPAFEWSAEAFPVRQGTVNGVPLAPISLT